MKIFGYHEDGSEDRNGRVGIAKFVITTPKGDTIHMPLAEEEFTEFLRQVMMVAKNMVKFNQSLGQ